MSVDDDNTEPVTDLGLSLRYSNRCIQRRLGNDSGAGANAAASRVEMTFVASNPLSELVWSPHKGLRLKSADCSLNKKRSSLLSSAGPSDNFFSPPQSILVERNNINKPMEEKNIITTLDSLNVKSEAGETATPRSSSRVMPACTSSSHGHGLDAGNIGNMEDMNTAVEASVSDIKGDLTDDKRKGKYLQVDVPGIHNNRDNISSSQDGSGPNMAYNESITGGFNKVISSDPTDGSGDVGSGNQKLDVEVVLVSEINALNQCRASDTPMPNKLSPGEKDQHLALFTEEESKTNMKITGSSGVPLEKVELTDENDLQALIDENVSGPAGKILGSESAHEVKNSSRQDEQTLPQENNILISHSPTNSRIQRYRRKGKEKALSDGDSTTKKSEEDDDSHESVESCNGAGLLSKGKKRWGCEQQLMIGSKRVKKQSQENPGSTTFIRQDSSFMSWISNMMKALPKSNKDEAPLALTLAQSNHEQEGPEQKDIVYNKNGDTERRNMGFQNIFKSLYCRDTKASGETSTMNAECQTNEGSNGIELAVDVCDVNVTPIACLGVSDIFCKQYLLANEKCDQSMSGNGAGLSTQLKIPTANFGAGQEKKTQSRENKVLCNLASDVEKGGVSPACSSLGKLKANSAGGNDSNPPPAAKALINFNNKSDPMGSLWITRFCQKTSAPMSKLNHCKQVTGGAVECSADHKVMAPHFLNLLDTSKERNLDAAVNSGGSPQNVVSKELQSCAANSVASFGLRGIKGHNGQKYVYRLNPDPSSKRLKSSEAMASIFARRLDALKHILPSDATGDAARATTTCFFCGIKGHDLRDCSEITESELEDLLRNIHSYDGAGKSPCLCIRCFQLNHWAVACPNVSSRRQISEGGDSMVNRGHERKPKLFENKESQSKVVVAHAAGSEKIPSMDAGLNLNQNLAANSIPTKNFIASNFEGNETKENPVPSYNFVNQQISDLPKGISDAIKRLRLSRTDIFKWMNSQVPLSHLNGFFLRLRLGKWEEGLGGTGYYVGCINGAQKENAPNGSKNRISVIIGGIKCLVESRYVSNHDFLEDELKTWWSVTSKSGGKVPSEEDMRQKLEERKKIGF